jgi:hypothetical protein
VGTNMPEGAREALLIKRHDVSDFRH